MAKGRVGGDERMIEPERLSAEALERSMARIACRPLLVRSPIIRFVLGPGDRALVGPGEAVLPGMPIAERTRDAGFVDVGRLQFVPAGEPTRTSPGAASNAPGDPADGAPEASAGLAAAPKLSSSLTRHRSLWHVGSRPSDDIPP